jgi:hypothetical protein
MPRRLKKVSMEGKRVMKHDHICNMSTYDSTMEMRSMILLSMPCPPMPMYVSQEMIDEVSYVKSENVVGNSHDLIAHLLNKATSLGSSTIHPKRKVVQEEVTALLYKRFDDWKANNESLAIPPLDISYGFFAEFTRSVLF